MQGVPLERLILSGGFGGSLLTLYGLTTPALIPYIGPVFGLWR